MELYLATNDGIVVSDGEDIVRRGLEEHHVSAVIAREGVVLAGTRDGVFRTDDAGRTWREASDGLDVRHIRWLAYHPSVSDFEVAGTEPANIYLSHDGGERWQAAPHVAELRDDNGWFLPYSPRSGCIRGLAFHGQRAYAAAEVGGALRSDDSGATWRMAPGSPAASSLRPASGQLHSDVHSIHVHASSPDLVLAPTGGGLYSSRDAGATWQSIYRCYCRDAWWDPADPQHIIFGPADGVDRGGRIEETYDGGSTWQQVAGGTDAPWARHMVERLSQLAGRFYAVLSNGQLLRANPADLTWRPILSDAGWVNAVASDL